MGGTHGNGTGNLRRSRHVQDTLATDGTTNRNTDISGWLCQQSERLGFLLVGMGLAGLPQITPTVLVLSHKRYMSVVTSWGLAKIAIGNCWYTPWAKNIWHQQRNALVQWRQGMSATHSLEACILLSTSWSFHWWSLVSSRPQKQILWSDQSLGIKTTHVWVLRTRCSKSCTYVFHQHYITSSVWR